MDFKEFWNHVSATYDGHLTGFPVLLIALRITPLVVCDSSCCEVGNSALNRTLTAARSRRQSSRVDEGALDTEAAEVVPNVVAEPMRWHPVLVTSVPQGAKLGLWDF